ncbi:hypothetical protein ABIE78_000073 [Sinorhizobium fredii]
MDPESSLGHGSDPEVTGGGRAAQCGPACQQGAGAFSISCRPEHETAGEEGLATSATFRLGSAWTDLTYRGRDFGRAGENGRAGIPPTEDCGGRGDGVIAVLRLVVVASRTTDAHRMDHQDLDSAFQKSGFILVPNRNSSVMNFASRSASRLRRGVRVLEQAASKSLRIKARSRGPRCWTAFGRLACDCAAFILPSIDVLHFCLC